MRLSLISCTLYANYPLPRPYCSSDAVPDEFPRTVRIYAVADDSEAERFLALCCVSRLGSSCVSPAITVRYLAHPSIAPGLSLMCIFRPLVFLQVVPQLHIVSAIPSSNVVSTLLLIVVDWFKFVFHFVHPVEPLTPSPSREAMECCSLWRFVAVLRSLHEEWQEKLPLTTRHQSIPGSVLSSVTSLFWLSFVARMDEVTYR